MIKKTMTRKISSVVFAFLVSLLSMATAMDNKPEGIDPSRTRQLRNSAHYRNMYLEFKKSAARMHTEVNRRIEKCKLRQKEYKLLASLPGTAIEHFKMRASTVNIWGKEYDADFCIDDLPYIPRLPGELRPSNCLKDIIKTKKHIGLLSGDDLYCRVYSHDNSLIRINEMVTRLPIQGLTRDVYNRIGEYAAENSSRVRDNHRLIALWFPVVSLDADFAEQGISREDLRALYGFVSLFLDYEKQRQELASTLLYWLKESRKSTPSPMRETKPVPFKGNWTESFQLKNGEVITHTPECIHFGSCVFRSPQVRLIGSFNGLFFSSEGLYLRLNSTKEEFAKALKVAGIL